ncbi:MAG: 50S ribosomal protein L9 [Paludibacter sp.]|nr:50S ribosomal protein L9 [Paludibacter sp.]
MKVKSGYGRNFLIPTKKAVLATESAKKMLAEDLKQRAHKLERIKNESLELAEKLKGMTLSVGAKTSTTGKIFGAVGPIQIAEAFEKAGFTVDRKVIVLKDAVKEVGTYTATLKLHKEVTVEVAFEVVAE